MADRPASPRSLLTRREWEVLRLLVQGAAYPEIARALGIPQRSVKVQVQGIFQKVGLGSRRELVEWAITEGLPDSSRTNLKPDSAAVAVSFTSERNAHRGKPRSSVGGSESVVVVGPLSSPISTDARSIVQRLASTLALTSDELSMMLDVSAPVIDQWRAGDGLMSASALAHLRDADAALDLLEAMFLPERLPEMIRRPARIFDGERALDWILRGQIQDVTEQYDRVLMYQL